MTQVIEIVEPGIGYYKNEAGEAIGKFDLEPGTHRVPDDVANVVYVESAGDLAGVSVPGRRREPDWRQRWQEASTTAEKLQVIEARFF